MLPYLMPRMIETEQSSRAEEKIKRKLSFEYFKLLFLTPKCISFPFRISLRIHAISIVLLAECFILLPDMKPLPPPEKLQRRKRE